MHHHQALSLDISRVYVLAGEYVEQVGCNSLTYDPKEPRNLFARANPSALVLFVFTAVQSPLPAAAEVV